MNKKIFNLPDYLTFALLTVLSYSVLVYCLTIWFSSGDWHKNPILLTLLSFVFLSKIAVSQLRWLLLPFMTKPEAMEPKSGWRVGVATTFVPGAESIEMLEETVRSLISMDYPHDTWVLDEGDDAEVKALCFSLGAFYFSRKNLPEYQTETGKFQARSKHGNYNSWLTEVGLKKYDLITTFDPDHIPAPNFLTEALGYFNDPEIGYVQSAQVYYNQPASFIARGAAEETYEYYSATQMFCHTMGYPIVTGCHTTHRAEALEQVGGLAAHNADDLLITLFYRTSGWKGVYVPKILARGLTPVDWDGYLKQQIRWARSVLDIKLWIHPKMVKKLGVKEAVVSVLHGFYYLQGLTTFVLLLLLAFMLATGILSQAVNFFVSKNFLLLVTVSLLCTFYRQRFYLDRKREWGLHWRAGVLQVAKYPYLLLALFLVILNRRFEYSITDKLRRSSRSYKPFLPHLFMAAVVGSGWIVGIGLGHTIPTVLHIAAAATVIGTVLLTSTGYIRFPKPYDPALSARVGMAELTVNAQPELQKAANRVL
ncbi:MAG: glycosyltransferase [Pyrinomonadaceae bacterium]